MSVQVNSPIRFGIVMAAAPGQRPTLVYVEKGVSEVDEAVASHPYAKLAGVEVLGSVKAVRQAEAAPDPDPAATAINAQPEDQPVTVDTDDNSKRGKL